MATDLSKLTAALANGNTVEAWRILERGAWVGPGYPPQESQNGAWEPLERMRSDEAPDAYKENPPHGHKGHRVSRNCDQCVENAS